MQDKAQEIIDDPQKLLNLIRLVHQLIHAYDRNEMEKEIQKQKGGTREETGISDSLSVVLKDSKGNIKQEMKGG